MRPVFFIQSFFPEFSGCDVAYFRATLIRARVSLHPREHVFSCARSRPFFFFVFFPFCGGLCRLRGLRVRLGSVRFTAKCVTSCRPLLVTVPSSEVAYPSSRPLHPRYPRIWRPIYIRNSCWVLSRCCPIETFIRAGPWSHPAVNFMHGVGRFTSFGHSCLCFPSALPAHTVKYRHFRGPRPMPRLVHH